MTKSGAKALPGHASIANLYDEHRTVVLNRCRKLLGNDEDARDAVQDIFVSLSNTIGSFRGEAQISTWLYRITTNYCLNRIRSNKNRDRAHGDLSLLIEGSTGTCPLGAIERRDLAWAILRETDPTTAAMLCGRFIEGLTAEELGARFGVTERTVRNRLRAGVERARTLHPRSHVAPVLLALLGSGIIATLVWESFEATNGRPPLIHSAPEGIRMKGPSEPFESVEDPAIELLAVRGGGFVPVEQARTRAGDRLVVRYTAGAAYLVLLDVSDDGVTTVLFGDTPESQALQPARGALLGVGLELDDDPRPEVIVAVLSNAPIDVGALLIRTDELVRSFGSEPQRAQVEEPNASVPEEIFLFRVMKETKEY